SRATGWRTGRRPRTATTLRVPEGPNRGASPWRCSTPAQPRPSGRRRCATTSPRCASCSSGSGRTGPTPPAAPGQEGRWAAAVGRGREADLAPLGTVIAALEALAAGPMAQVVRLLELGAGTEKESLAAGFRKSSLPVQDRIIKELEEILVRLLRNEEAKK